MRYTFFVTQVVMPTSPARALRQQLRSLVTSAPKGQSYDDKRRFYRHLGETMASFSPHFTKGVWDYVEEPDRAQEEYDKWTKGTVQDARDAEAERAGIGGVYREVGKPTFMFVTLLFLLRKGGTSDRFICEECRMPEEEYWRRATVARLLSRTGLLNFPSVRSDAVYMRPGVNEWGLTEEELSQDIYDYLRTLTD